MREDRTEQFQQTLSRLLRPIARAMIAHGVTLNAATEALKSALYNAATDLSAKDEKVTDSKISLRTGLHRKDVRRLREASPRPEKRSLTNACTLAIAYWTSNDRFQTKAGTPRTLPRTGTRSRPGFDELVKTAKIDLPASTLLEALVAQDAVTRDADADTVTLVQTAFLASPQSEAMIAAYQKNLLAHLEAATENLLAKEGEPRKFERAAHFNQLSATSIKELDAEARRLSQNVLESLNRKALALQEKDATIQGPKGRFSIGTYIIGNISDTDATDDDQESQ